MIGGIGNILEQKFTEKPKLSKKDENNSDFNIKFDDLLTGETKKTDKNDNVEINIEVKNDKYNENTDEKVKSDDKNDNHKTYKDENKSGNTEKKDDDKKINYSFLVPVNDKFNTKIDKSKKENESISVKTDKTKGNPLKSIEDNSLKESRIIKLKFEDLDPSIKDRIRNILNDFRTGKIDESSANRMIAEIISGSKVKQLQGIDKNSILSVKLNSQKENDFSNSKFNHINVNHDAISKIDKKEIKISSDDKKSENLITDKKDLKKILEKSKTNQTEIAKETDLKDFKSEIRLDINDVKLANNQSPKERAVNIEKALTDNKEQIFDNIAKNTKIILANNETKFSTMIRPESMGRIDFKFTIKEGKIEGRMILQNQEAADFFRANVEELKAVFSKANVEMGNIDIALAGQGTNWGGTGQEKNFSDENNKTISNEYISKVSKTFEENNVSNTSNYSNLNNSKVNIFI